MTIHNTGYYYIRRSTVPLAKVCSSISENLRIVHADETDQLSVEVIPAPGGVEVDGTVVHPNPVIREIGQVLSEMALALQPQIRGLETISAAQRNRRGPDSSLKGLGIFIYTSI